MTKGRGFSKWVWAAVVLGVAVVWSACAVAQGGDSGYGLKIYKVESGLYPFVQVYFRTFDANMQPLVNVNLSNIGLMVQGRPYDPAKRQYVIQTLQNRREGTRTVIVLDASRTMAGAPFQGAYTAVQRFIDSKRPEDEVAIVAVRGGSGYEMVSSFERDGGALQRRLADVRCDSSQTRLYDAIGSALQMCGMAGTGGATMDDADYVVSSSILVASDGQDEGSALTRGDLMGRISGMKTPIPIYTMSYAGRNVNSEYARNLEALAKNSFGGSYSGYGAPQRNVENVQRIQQGDYVLTFRSYLPVDGQSHPVKVGIEYPSGTGKMTYQGATFEAVDMPGIGKVGDEKRRLEGVIPALPDQNPYYAR